MTIHELSVCVFNCYFSCEADLSLLSLAFPYLMPLSFHLSSVFFFFFQFPQYFIIEPFPVPKTSPSSSVFFLGFWTS